MQVSDEVSSRCVPGRQVVTHRQRFAIVDIPVDPYSAPVPSLLVSAVGRSERLSLALL